MKKVMFVVLSLLIASACFALESGPSNKVGYTKITAGANGFTAFGVAFRTWTVPVGGIPTYGTDGTKPSDIIGDQAFCDPAGAATSDRIISQGVGSAIAFRNVLNACAWTSTLETASGMTSSKAYWYRNFQATARDVVIAGEADVTTLPVARLIGAGTQTVPNYTPYAWRDPRSRNRDDLQLVLAGMHAGNAGGSPPFGDRLVDQPPASVFAIRSSAGGGSWVGSLVLVEPGRAYWILNRAASYNYQYDPTSDATLSMPGGSKFSGSADIQKMATPKAAVKKAGATN